MSLDGATWPQPAFFPQAKCHEAKSRTVCGVGRTTESWAPRDKCGNHSYAKVRGIRLVFLEDSIGRIP